MIPRITSALTLALVLAACSNEPATAEESENATAATSAAPASADDDTLEPGAPKVEAGEEHNEDAPHAH